MNIQPSEGSRLCAVRRRQKFYILRVVASHLAATIVKTHPLNRYDAQRKLVPSKTKSVPARTNRIFFFIAVPVIFASAISASAFLLRAKDKQTQDKQTQNKQTQDKQTVITGSAAFADWTQEKPGVLRKILVTDLPEPASAESVRNQPRIVARPQNAWPIAPPGFKVTLYAGGDNGPSLSPDQQHSQQHNTKLPDSGTFTQPRLIRCAPNGDLFVADSGGGAIVVLRGVGADGKAAKVERFATGLDHPFGIAFFPAGNPQFVYVANTTSMVRFAYKSGDLHASGQPETA
jgi:glucose/arabinose dehydrogenase